MPFNIPRYFYWKKYKNLWFYNSRLYSERLEQDELRKHEILNKNTLPNSGYWFGTKLGKGVELSSDTAEQRDGDKQKQYLR